MTVLAALQARVARGDLRDDPRQAEAAERLDVLLAELARAGEPAPSPARGGGWLRRMLGVAGSAAPSSGPTPRGLYIHGDVGRGKSMLMDLFFSLVQLKAKRRVHFHEFMLEVQKRLNGLRQAGRDDPLMALAGELAGEARLLCFDEFHVVNIADAMILARLFGRLFELGVVTVATSNWPPRRLYEGGLNRDRFLPFIDLLTAHVDVLSLDGETDYRLTKLPDLPIFISPLGPEADARIDEAFAILAENAEPAPGTVAVGARRIEVPRMAGSVAAFPFDDLCNRPLGAADYLALTERFAVLIVTDVPLLSPARRNEARRLMTLVDALYERKTVLIMSMAAAPAALYPEGEGAFEFQRTVSRLTEMQSSTYLEAARDRHPDKLPTDFMPFALTSDVT